MGPTEKHLLLLFIALSGLAMSMSRDYIDIGPYAAEDTSMTLTTKRLSLAPHPIIPGRRNAVVGWAIEQLMHGIWQYTGEQELCDPNSKSKNIGRSDLTWTTCPCALSGTGRSTGHHKLLVHFLYSTFF